MGVDAVGQCGGVVEAAMCYTGDVTDPSRGLYDLEYYLSFVRELDAAGVHVLAIKDMVRSLYLSWSCVSYLSAPESPFSIDIFTGWIAETKWCKNACWRNQK